MLRSHYIIWIAIVSLFSTAVSAEAQVQTAGWLQSAIGALQAHHSYLEEPLFLSEEQALPLAPLEDDYFERYRSKMRGSPNSLGVLYKELSLEDDGTWDACVLRSVRGVHKKGYPLQLSRLLIESNTEMVYVLYQFGERSGIIEMESSMQQQPHVTAILEMR